MVDLFNGKIISKIKQKNGRPITPDCSQGHVQFQVGNYCYLVGGYVDHNKHGLADEQEYVKLRDLWRFLFNYLFYYFNNIKLFI